MTLSKLEKEIFELIKIKDINMTLLAYKFSKFKRKTIENVISKLLKLEYIQVIEKNECPKCAKLNKLNKRFNDTKCIKCNNIFDNNHILKYYRSK